MSYNVNIKWSNGTLSGHINLIQLSKVKHGTVIVTNVVHAFRLYRIRIHVDKASPFELAMERRCVKS